MPEGAVITGWAALRLAGGRYFDGLAPDGLTELPVPIALPRTARMRHPGELALIRSAVTKADRLELHDVHCAPLDRAVFDEV